jgi:sRNA-binding carbon storage regulator CsrA
MAYPDNKVGRITITRRVGEEVYIFAGDQQIVVRLSTSRDGTSRITFTADKEVGIYRRELYENMLKGIEKKEEGTCQS